MKTSNVVLFFCFLLLFFSCSKEKIQLSEKEENQIEAKKANPPGAPVLNKITFYSDPITLTWEEFAELNEKMYEIDNFCLTGTCNALGCTATFNPDFNDSTSNARLIQLPNSNLVSYQIVGVVYTYLGLPGDNDPAAFPIWNYLGGNLEARTSPVQYSNCVLANFEFSENEWDENIYVPIDIWSIFNENYCPETC